MQPEHARLMQQAAALHRRGDLRGATETYQRLLAACPGLPDCWFDLAWLLKAQAQPEAALAAYAQALAQGVRGPEEVHLNRAVIYTDMLRRDAEAEAELRLALASAPAYPPALLNLGNLHEERGQREPAQQCYQQVVATLPETGTARQQAWRAEALARLAHLRPPTAADDPLLDQLRRAAGPGLAPGIRANVLFALGRAYDALGLPGQAFPAFAAANQEVARTGPRYDRQHAEQQRVALQRQFAHPARSQPTPPDLAAPLFICGMFRSGSTLLEQALAAHPQVHPGGELDFFPRLVAGPLAPFPASIAALPPVRYQDFAVDYRAGLQRQFPEALHKCRYITDKRPDNYQLLGLIKQVFPAARFIHTVRDPRDVGLSIFMHHLDQQVLGYSSRLADIGHHYGQYQRLMRHWQGLYGDSILDFDYDHFVRAPRPALQAVLDFLGLDWHDGCLQFHTLRNSVKTASYWQVRRPLYGDASGRWRNYAGFLPELLQALREADVALPEAPAGPLA